MLRMPDGYTAARKELVIGDRGGEKGVVLLSLDLCLMSNGH